MTRALVLGGGGPLGIGWQAGLLAGLTEAGIAMRDADLVVGTSAGSVVGARLTTGGDLAGLVDPISNPPAGTQTAAPGGSRDLAELIAAGGGGGVSEEVFLSRFAFLHGQDWPATFRCTSVNMDTGDFSVWDASAGVDLDRGVASSCAIPVLTTTVTIDGAQYMDGGARDVLNVDLATGFDRVVAVSCVVLDPAESRVPAMLADRLPGVRTRIDELRASGAELEVVQPSDEVQELSGWGAHLMDHMRTAAAFDAGVRQAEDEARRIASLWSE
jgi:NTE family protein